MLIEPRNRAGDPGEGTDTRATGSLRIAGCSVTRIEAFLDLRGSFRKPFTINSEDAEAQAPVREVFWSASHIGVIRGMHVQGPESASAKTIFVVSGLLHDVVLDLRRDSSTYGEFTEIRLDPDRVLHVPAGCAHGFQALEQTTMVYLSDQPYCRESDHGIRYDSFGMRWPLPNPLVSARDLGLPTLSDYESPFR